LPYFRLLGAQLAIGAAAIFARYALEGAGPFAVSALRLAIAAALAIAVAVPLRRLSARREIAFACAGLALAAHFATWIASLLYTSVAMSTLLVTTTPLWTQAYEAVRLRRLPSRRFLAALAFALAGVLGDALALAGSVAIGAYLIIVRDAGARHASPLGTRQIVARTYGWSAVALVLGAAAAGQPAPALANATAWFGILAMALVSQLIGHTALNAALRDFSPSTVALTTLLEPVVAAGLALLLFHERLSAQTAAGGVLVIVAVALALRGTSSDVAPA
jgi:drug/metabolite transporter (DMT)-like permease